MKTLWIVFGNHLFDPKHFGPPSTELELFMAEDLELCTHFRYHQKKIALFLLSMRHFRDEMTELGFKVNYHAFPEAKESDYESKLLKTIRSSKISKIKFFEIEDRFMEIRILDFCKENKISFEIEKNPMFLTTRMEFRTYLKTQKKPFMKTFYEQRRKALNVLVDKNAKPLGGKWSFDTENRKKLPKNVNPVAPRSFSIKHDDLKLKGWIEKNFDSHPGNLENFVYPTTRPEAKAALKDFIENRLRDFGEYEDAISSRSDFVFHSVLTPTLNLGWLTPQEVVDEAIRYSQKYKVPLNSLEGFIRQVIGWREFVRGIYQNYGQTQQISNFFNHTRKLTSAWYEGKTAILPLDSAIKKVMDLGYLHHIERLMIVSNLMLLCRIDPKEVYRWFMELFVDSSDWVMGPNVFGMGQFSDGGIFATKPYICGSNYILKMSDYTKGPWCEKIDALYWAFIDDHREFFLKNYRMSTMVRMYDRFPKEKQKLIKSKALNTINELTQI